MACEAKAPPAAASAGDARVEARAEPAKAEPAKAEPAKAEPAKAEPLDESENREPGTAEPGTAEPEPDTAESGQAKPAGAPVPVASAWSARVQPASLPAKAPATSILAQAHAHGAPVAIVSADAGLRLVSLEGLSRTLVAGKVDKAIYEPRTGVLLFLRDETLHGVDLHAPLAAGATPEAVALTKPATFDLDDPELEIRLPDNYWVSSSKDDFAARLSLTWGPKPALSWSEGESYDDFDEGEGEGEGEAQPKISLIHAEWLSSRAERLAWPAPGFGPLEFSYQPDEGYEAQPGYEGRCSSWTCGEALPLGTSGLELVITADDFGDFGHVLSLVHDPAKQRYIAYSAWLEGTDAWFPASELSAKREEHQDEHTPFFDATGRVFAPYLGAEQLCTTAVSCAQAGGAVIDFLAGGVEVGPAISQR